LATTSTNSALFTKLPFLQFEQFFNKSGYSTGILFVDLFCAVTRQLPQRPDRPMLVTAPIYNKREFAVSRNCAAVDADYA